MSEFELISLYRDWVELYWSMVEFFVGLSFAVIVGFFMAGQHLKRVFALFAVLLYSAFSIVQIWLITVQDGRLAAIRGDLAALYSDKAEVPAIVASITAPSLGKIGSVVLGVYIGIWLGTIIFAYFHSAIRDHRLQENVRS